MDGWRFKTFVVAFASLVAVCCSQTQPPGFTFERVSSRGKEFLLGFGPQVPDNSITGTNRLYISSFKPTDVQLKMPSESPKTYQVVQGEVTIVDLPAKARMDSSNLFPNAGKIEKKGILLTSKEPVSVHALQMMNDAFEGYLGLPTAFIGKMYVVPTYSPTSSSFIQVVAKENTTSVSFHLQLRDDQGKGQSLQYNNTQYNSGDTLTIQLGYLESFLLISFYDFTGTRVSSTKPVAVLSGNECAFVPLNKPPCNYLVEQIPPLSYLGTSFIASPVEERATKADIYHVLAANDDTSVYNKGNFLTRLKEGKYWKLETKDPVEITTSKPSLLVQYSPNQRQNLYSPLMTIIPSKNQWTNDYILEIPKSLSGNSFEAFINIVIETNHRDGVRVKSATLTDRFNWTETANKQFSTTSFRLNGRLNHVFHSSPLVKFLAIFYGESKVESNDGVSKIIRFGFPAGVVDVTRLTICSQTVQSPGDGVDNDCDGRIDEEVFNGVDDDKDGAIDEDRAVPKPDVKFPLNTSVVLCDSNASKLRPASTGKAEGKGRYQCETRGAVNISYEDVVSNKTNCSYVVERRWKVQDACENVERKSQYIVVKTPVLPQVTIPSDVRFTCRKIEYLTKHYTGQEKVGSVVCPGTSVISNDSPVGSCGQQKAELHRTWTIKNECKEKAETQTITLLPRGGIRFLKNYVAIFTLSQGSFSDELKDAQSQSFKSLAYWLKKKIEDTFMESKNGELFVGADVLEFRNGSVIPHVRLRFDNSSQITPSDVITSFGSLKKWQGEQEAVITGDIKIQDYDECLKPEDNECDKNANCSNIPASYRCICRQGFFGDGIVCQAPPKVIVTDHIKEASLNKNITLRCGADGVPPPEFTWTTPNDKKVNSNISVESTNGKDSSSVVEVPRGKVLQKDGSLLVYGMTADDDGIYKCEATNVMGSDSGEVNLTLRNDFVQVDVVLTLVEKKFTEKLEDTTSKEYKALEMEVKDELTVQFQNLTGFVRVEILGFVNGSVKVEFRVVVKVDKKTADPKVQAKVVANTLQVKIKKGKLGNLKVKKTLELKEIAPPPKDVKYSNLKTDEVRIDWSSPELDHLYSINGYSLEYRKFAAKQWEMFDMIKGTNRRLDGLEPGVAYMARLKSKNPYGVSEPSPTLEFKTPEEEGPTKLVLAIVLPLILLVILAVVGFVVYKKWQKRKAAGYITTDGGQEMEMVIDESHTAPGNRYARVPGPNEEGAVSQSIPASFTGRQLQRDRLELGKVLGEGEFGVVTKAELTEDDGRIVPCAVKTLKRNATESDFKDLLNELDIMHSAGQHSNIVNLIGACVDDGPLMVVVEFAPHGQLLRYLRNHRTQNYDNMNEYTLDIPLIERLNIAVGVADGMTHLGKMKCVHRDLAARNVLLGEGMVAKVSDFGLSRDIYTDNVYQKQTGGKLPAKWMAIESLECGTYTSQSDVWSFGVLLWEIETGGCAPYAGLNVRTLLDELKNGHRLERPRYCTPDLYTIMRSCWDPNPSQRPTFAVLAEEIQRLSQSQEDYLVPDQTDKQPLYANVHT